ncbi:MAG: tetratricopeptide repeat protein [Janthinobacterium lividum]
MNEVAKKHFLRAEKLRLEGNIDSSITALLAAVNVDPNYAAAHHNLGFLYERKHKMQRALAEYEEALRLDPRLEKGYVNMGALLVNSGGFDNFTKAISVHQKAISLFPKNVKLHYNLGNAYVGLGQREHAISAYSEAIQYDPNFYDAYANLGRELVLNEDWVAAVSIFRQAIASGPVEPALRYALCSALIQIRKTTEAIAEFKELIRDNPQDAKGYFQIGRAYLIQAMQEKSKESIRLAEEALKKSLLLKPFNLQTINMLYQAYNMRKKSELV